MKKITLFLITALCAVTAPAQLLWKITGGDTYRPSYLFGTIHLETAQFIDSVPGLAQAIESVDAVCGEVVEDQLTSKNAMGAFLKDAVAPEDSTLDRLVSPDDCAVVDRVMRSYTMGIVGVEQLKKYKPMTIVMQLEMMQLMKHFPEFRQTGDALDFAIQRRAEAMGKHSQGFESIAEQMQALYGASLREQAADLVEMCRRDGEYESYNRRLVAAYRSQDFAALEQLMLLGDDAMKPEQLERLAYARNRRWMDRITTTLPVQRILIAVGAAHLMGEQGLIALLRQRGYTVEPVTL